MYTQLVIILKYTLIKHWIKYTKSRLQFFFIPARIVERLVKYNTFIIYLELKCINVVNEYILFKVP